MTASLAFWMSGAALAQDATVYSEQGQLVRASKNVTVLGSDLMGDQVNLYTGSVEFVQTDVSLPGNDALKVSVGRHYATSVPRQNKYEGLFLDWDLEIPHMHGIYAANPSTTQGWVVTAPNPNDPARLQRCTHFGAPPEAVNTATHALMDPEVFWSGHSLYIPGAGDMKMLIRDAANTTTPTDSNTYPIVTTSNWQIRCITAPELLASPETVEGTQKSGEGFIAVSPEGIQYKFNWIVSRAYQAKAGTPTGFNRQEVWILPTVVTDRFGNTVTYNYDTTDPWKLTSIVASDGRTIGLTYGTGHRVSSVFDGTRTWNYSYAATALPYKLSGVTMPGTNGAWAFNLNEQGPSPVFSPSQGCHGSPATWDAGTLVPSALQSSITHPSGAIGTFNFAYVMHGRSGMSLNPANPCPGLSPDAETPAYSVRSLISKTISGPGIVASAVAPATTPTTPAVPSGLTWTYSWGPANWSFYCTGSCPTTKTLDVLDPRGFRTRYTYGNQYAVSEGQLQRVDEGWNGTTAVRTTTSTYAAAGSGPFPLRAGVSGSEAGDDIMETRFLPLVGKTITQQGVNFNWQVTSFEPLSTVTFPRVTGVSKWSALASTPTTPYSSKTEVTAYSDNKTKWVMGQTASLTVGGISPAATSTTFDATTALPTSKSAFGKPQATYTFNGDGTLSTVTDGNSHTTTYSLYRRGLAQNIAYADSTSQSAVVNNIGTIDSVTNEVHTTWAYGYDAMGRLSSITPPSGDSVLWNPTTIAYQKYPLAEHGLSGGHWIQTVTTGTGVTVNYFDALYRKVFTTTSDTAVAGTTKSQLANYDADSRVTAQSYPSGASGAAFTALSIPDTLPGTSTVYDALGRPVTQTADGPNGLETTQHAYLANFNKQVTDPKSNITTTTFQTFDQPSESTIASLTGPQGLNLSIVRDVLGKATSMTKFGSNGGPTTSVTRSYVYDGYQLLCKTIEPELGATLQEWDPAGNLLWRTGGTSLTSGACDRSSVAPSQQIAFGYDARNRLLGTVYGDGSPSISRTYTSDGLPDHTTSNGSVWINLYDNRRLVTSETLTLGGVAYPISWAYDPNGNVNQLTYPDPAGVGNNVVPYLTNALGQPTRIGSYATGITHSPTGAVAGFLYGNGVVHTMTQTVNGLPSLMTDTGMIQDLYAYDNNNNVTSITDQTTGGLGTRSMTYDGLDRLKTANGIWGSGAYSYDVQDNIVSSAVGARVATHSYDASNRLSTVSGTGVNLTYGYDSNGNINSRSGQAFNFDLGNRMSGAPGQSSYTYDGFGRRTKISNVDGSSEVQVYSPSTGQILFAQNTQGSAAATLVYSCPAGQTLSGTGCLLTTTVAASVASYTCPGGYTLSGSTCTQTTSVAATLTGYSCPGGYTLSGSTCSQTTTTTSAATASYSCPGGQTLSGTSCIATSSAPATPVYSCPGGYTLSGATCNGTTTAAATATPSCNGHGTLTTSTISSTGTYCLLQNISFKVNPDPEQVCGSLATTDGLVMDPNSAGTGGVNYRCILTPISPTHVRQVVRCPVPVASLRSPSARR